MTDIASILANEDKINQVVKAVFDQFDTNGDGTIDRDELSSVMEQFKKESGCEQAEVTEEQLQEAYNELDTNKDGKLQMEEFKVLIVEVLKTLA